MLARATDRWFPFVLLAVVAFMGAGLPAGEDPRGKADAGKTGASEKGGADKAGKPVPFFNVDEFFHEYDTNKDGFLSKDELPERFRRNFDRLDTNKDGKLSKEELQKGVAYLQPQRRPSDFVYILVEMSDCDECCAEELQTAYDFLRKLDRNHNGKIDASELKEAREGMVRERVDAIFKALDSNKDGEISKDEAKGQIRRHFDDLDANKDGKISRDELLRAASEKPGELPKRTVLPGKGTGSNPEK